MQKHLDDFMNAVKQLMVSNIRITVTGSIKEQWEDSLSLITVVDAGDCFAVSGNNNRDEDVVDIVSIENLKTYNIEFTTGVAFICMGCKIGERRITEHISNPEDYATLTNNIVEYQGKYYNVSVVEEKEHFLIHR